MTNSCGNVTVKEKLSLFSVWGTIVKYKNYLALVKQSTTVAEFVVRGTELRGVILASLNWATQQWNTRQRRRTDFKSVRHRHDLLWVDN